MTTIPYQPPEREFESTFTALRDFNLASAWSVRIDPDPLGPVNQIVRLMRGGKQVRAAAAHIPEGAKVTLIRDEGGYRIEDVVAEMARLRDEGGGTGHVDYRVPGWRVTVDDRTVLTVTDAELAPKPPRPPRAPLWTRLRRRASQRARSSADRLAGRLGYHRDDECGWDE